MSDAEQSAKFASDTANPDIAAELRARLACRDLDPCPDRYLDVDVDDVRAVLNKLDELDDMRPRYATAVAQVKGLTAAVERGAGLLVELSDREVTCGRCGAEVARGER